MIEVPFAFQWSIPEDELLSLKDSVNGRLCTANVTNIPEFKYYLQLSPNGNKDKNRGITYIFLHLQFKNVKKVEADFTITIESANYSNEHQSVYDESVGWGGRICNTEEFYDREKKYVVDGKCVVKVNGLFKFESEDAPELINEQKWIGSEMGNDLWSKDDTKDITISFEGGKEIKVHKFILAVRSENVLSKLFNSNRDETPDCYFLVMECVFKLIYNCNFTALLSFDELTSLLRCFFKCDLTTLKAKIEPYLIDNISAATVCTLTNISNDVSSLVLKEKCIQFLMDAVAFKTPLFGITDLNKDIALEILENFLNQYTETSAVNEQQKWIGGELGDDAWKKENLKDFTIITADAKEIKVHKFILENRSDVFNAMLKTNMKESKENKMQIIDFSFNVVEAAFKIIYNCNFESSLSLDELLSLLQFFDKYNLTTFKTKVESLLITQISAATACRLTNGSILTNSFILKNKCIQFLMDSFASKTGLNDIKTLDKDIALEILEDSLYQIVETEKL